jgi:hypothetical protein
MTKKQTKATAAPRQRVRKATPKAIATAHEQLDAIFAIDDPSAHDVTLTHLDYMLKSMRRGKEVANGR